VGITGLANIPHPRFSIEEVMEQKIDLTKGGIVVVMIGNTGMVKEYAKHASVRFIDCKETPGDMLESIVPENTRVAIITDGMPQYHYTWITSFCRRKNIPFLNRKSNQAIYEQLKSFFPNGDTVVKPTVEEVKDAQVKGKLTPLLQFIDFSKSNAENAKLLLRKAQEMDIRTTEASLSQLVSNVRRKQSGGTVPRSARSKLDVSVEMLDNSIRELQSMRDYLIEVTEENRMLRQKVERFKKVIEE
jgi:hypothetical protein